MTTFHEGQEVEVKTDGYGIEKWRWAKGKIIAPYIANGTTLLLGIGYDIRLDDGSSGIFDENHIRPVSP